MSTHTKTLTFATALAVALATSLANAGDGFTHLLSEAYGRASGDTPLPNVGLILELVDGDTPAPKLRLFGGFPGNEARIVIAPEKAQIETESGIWLTGGASISVSGEFDANGYFVAELGDIPSSPFPTSHLFAQGTHTGPWGIADAYGSMLELSNGVEFYAAEVDEQILTLDELLSHLPEDRTEKVENADGLQEKLYRALNSPGDAVSLKLGLEATVGVGAAVGGKTKHDFQVKRTEDAQYLLSMEADVAAQVGVELYDGVEANVSQGIGGARIFRFHSVPGVVRGIRGLLLACYYPELQPKKFINGVLDDCEAREKAKAALDAARAAENAAVAKLHDAEALLFGAADTALEKANKALDKAEAELEDAKKALANAKIETPKLVAAVVKAQAVVEALEIGVKQAKKARDTAKAAVNTAQEIADAAREEREAALNALVHLHRMIWVITQTRTYVTDHNDGLSYHLETEGEIEAAIGIPGVTLKNFGASASAGVESKCTVLWQFETEYRPRRLTITRHMEIKAAAWAGYEDGVRAETNKALELVDAFQFENGGVERIENRATISSDLALLHGYGALVARMEGIGRSWSIGVAQENLFATATNFTDLLSDEGLAAAFAGTDFLTVGYSLQDRRILNWELEAKASYAGNGGGIEGSIEWADQGRMLGQEMTLKEAANRLVDRVMP